MTEREFRDFTASSPLERAAAKLAQWLREPAPDVLRVGQAAATGDDKEDGLRDGAVAVRRKYFSLSQRKYCATLWAVLPAGRRRQTKGDSDGPRGDGGGPSPVSHENESLFDCVFGRGGDFPVSPFAHDFERWFGFSTFWVLSSSSSDRGEDEELTETGRGLDALGMSGLSITSREVSPSEAQSLLSCVIMALTDAGPIATDDDEAFCDTPVLINVFEANSGTAFGYAFVRTRNDVEPLMLRIDSDSTRRAPQGYGQLSGIYERFQEVLRQHEGTSAMGRSAVSLAVQETTTRVMSHLLENFEFESQAQSSRSVVHDEHDSSSDGGSNSSDEFPEMSRIEALSANSYASFPFLIRDSPDELSCQNQFYYSKFAPHISMPLFLPNDTKLTRLVLLAEGDDDDQQAPLMASMLYRLYSIAQKARRFASLADILGTEAVHAGPQSLAASTDSVEPPEGVAAVLSEIQAASDTMSAISRALDESFAIHDDLGDLEDVVGCETASDIPSIVSAAPLQSTISRIIVRTVLCERPERSDLRSLVRVWREATRRYRFHWDKKIPLNFEQQVGADVKMPIDLSACMIQQHTEMLELCIRETLGGDVDPELDLLQSARKEKFLEHVQTHDPGVPLWVPIVKSPPPMTGKMIEEQQALFEGMGTSSSAKTQRAEIQSTLLDSDMASFKAANPGCSFEDFVRWHSPPDWVIDDEHPNGTLSKRFMHGGDSDGGEDFRALWHEAWSRAEPVAAMNQPPLFNVEQTAEKALHQLETLSPEQLLDQLFACTLSLCVHFLFDSVAHAENVWHFRAPARLNNDLEVLRQVLKARASGLGMHRQCFDKQERAEWDAGIAELLGTFSKVEGQVSRWMSLCKLMHGGKSAARAVSHEIAHGVACDLFEKGWAGVPKSFRSVVRHLFSDDNDHAALPDRRELILRSRDLSVPTRLNVVIAPSEFRVATVTGCS